MFYDAIENRHGLPHDPLKALLVPRPIGWISTVSRDGICNLAPYSFFNGVGEKPGYVVFGSAGIKDSLKNIEENGEFVCSMATWDLRFHMNMSSASVPYGVDEFPLAGLTAVASKLVKPPRVKESPVALECKYVSTTTTPRHEKTGKIHHLVLGLVIGVYIDDRFITGGLVDTGAMKPIARMGYRDYAVVLPENVFTLGLPELDAKGNVTGPWEKVEA